MKNYNIRVLAYLLASFMLSVVLTSCHKLLTHNYEYGISFEIDGAKFEEMSTYSATGLCLLDVQPTVSESLMKLYWQLPSSPSGFSSDAESEHVCRDICVHPENETAGFSGAHAEVNSCL